MQIVEKRDRVQELDDVPAPSLASPDPIVLADEDTMVLAYESTVGRATLVVFQQCFASHFGPPNDQAYATHLLPDLGLPPCGAFEVETSSWIRGLETRNRGHPRHDPGIFARLRHWVWTFHDSVLECAALGYTTQELEGRPADLVPRMQALLAQS